MKHLYIVLLVFLIISCDNKEKNTNSSIENNIEGVYDIEYPEYWKMDDSGKMGTTFILIRENEDSSQTFNENINLIIQNLPQEAKNLNEFTSLTKEQLRGLDQVKILNSEDIILDEKPAHILEYHANLTGRPLHYIQYYMVKNNQVYILTYTNEIKNNYDHQKEVLNILNSFRY